MPKDIAIIGMAGRFPGAANVQQLLANLSRGHDSVGEITGSRVERTTLDRDRPCMVAGYLDDIDVFDHSFFTISAGEAQTMDPHTRLLLEVAYETFENAAYPVDELKKYTTAVFVADAALEYYKHADTFIPTLATGNTKAFLASFLARQFDLRGNSLLIDTTCSSSLLAVHLACNELLLGDADLALACGANLYLFPYKEGVGLDLDAPDGRSKAFSAQANGMSHGEAVACVLLKPLAKALADGDIIHAIIKGSAVNSNARRSASITAPDSQAQAEVIKKAWKNAGIPPRKMGFIEAHGSGTELGDNIEVGGFTLAFNQYTTDKQFCPVSTIKSNIGHTRSAAGISGLIKTILSLKHKTLFPTIHFEEPHPQINFNRSAVFVNRQLQYWEQQEGPRYAGVSSIGLSGTNCHMVLEEAPPQPVIVSSHIQHHCRLFLISSKTQQGLKENAKALRDSLPAFTGNDLADISYTLGVGRTHYSQRAAIAAGSLQELEKQLEHISGDSAGRAVRSKAVNKIIFVFDDTAGIPDINLCDYFITRYAVFRQYYTACSKAVDDNAAAGNLVFQYCFYKMLEAYGIVSAKLLARGTGKIVADIIKERINWSAAGERLAQYIAEPAEGLQEKVAALIARETAEGPVAFVSMGGWNRLSEIVMNQAAVHEACYFIPLQDAVDTCPFIQLLRTFYEMNYNVNWKTFFDHAGGRKTELPAYRFTKTRCWIRDTPKLNGTAGNTLAKELVERKSLLPAGEPELAYELAGLWQELLSIDHFSANDNFFSLGGDSLLATRLVNRINTTYGVNLSFEDVFDFPTLRGLTDYINSICGTSQKIYKIWKDVLKQDNLLPDDNFFELGGHSLIANQVINRVRHTFNVEISFDDFFKYPTLRTLAAFLDNRPQCVSEQSLPLIEQLPGQQKAEVSHAQKRIWILSQTSEGAMAYNQPGLYEIRSPLNVAVLKQSFDALVERHESLRTTFAVEEGELVQQIHSLAGSGFAFEYKDYRQVENAKDVALNEAAEQALQPFDLEKGPLMRVLLIQVGDASFIFLLDLHHIITDGWSNGVLIHDLLLLYKAFSEGKDNPLAPLRIHYKEYACWQNNQLRSGLLDKQRDYWLQQFGDGITALQFPTDFKRPAVKSYAGRIIEFSVDAALTQQVKQLGRRTDCTLFMLLLTNLYILLYRFTGQQDITIGTPVANRDNAELEDQVGFYVNTLAIRARFNPNDTVERVLEIVKANTLQAYANSAYPFDLLADQLPVNREPGRSPLFDVMLTLQNMENRLRYKDSDLPAFDVTSYETDILVSKFDLTFSVSETDERLDVVLEYDTALFTEKTIQKIKEGFITLLGLITSNARQRITELRNTLYESAEQEQVAFYKAFSETDLG